MTLEGWFTVAVVVGATGLMVAERFGPEIVMFGALCVLTVVGVLSPAEALAGFARPEIGTVGILFVVAAATQETGALARLTHGVFGATRSPREAVFRLVLPVAGLSAFLNNTPIVAMMVPEVGQFCRRTGISPRSLMIPLAWASMLGGTCTLIGTSVNLVVSGMLQERGAEPIGMFEIGWVGVPTAIVGILYLITAGTWLLARGPVKPGPGQCGERRYLLELKVRKGSPMAGRDLASLGLTHMEGLDLTEVEAPTGRRTLALPRYRLQGGEILRMHGTLQALQALLAMPGLEPRRGRIRGARLFEVALSHASPLTGLQLGSEPAALATIGHVVGLHRVDQRLDGPLDRVRLLPGDVLVLSGDPPAAASARSSTDFYLTSQVDHEDGPDHEKAPLAMVAVTLMVVVPALSEVPMFVSAGGALVFLVATGCVSPRRAREAVAWPVLVLIGASIGVARAMERSGVAEAAGGMLAQVTDAAGPYGLLVALYVVTATLACFISNVAAAVLVFPVAMTTAEAAGLLPRPFAVALALAASAAFSSPTGYMANMLVYAPGGYRYADYTRVGLPLNLLLLAVATVLIPLLWPFQM